MQFNIELTTDHRIRFYWAGSPDKKFASASAVSLSNWTHIALTYDGNQVLIYKDGILQTDKYTGTLATKNKTSGVFYLGRDSRTGNTVLNGGLNDFRIYNRCLSYRECKSISAGLVVHYPLSGIGNPNLVPHTSLKTSYIVANEDGMTFSAANPSSDSRGWGLSYAQHKINLTAGTYTCTIWIDEPTNNSNRAAHLYKTSGLIKSGLATLIEKGCYNYTFTLTEQDDVGVEIKIYDGKYHLKIEKGDKSTPWLPNSEDPEYAALGLNDGIEYDVSGYKYNGTKNGNFSYSSDTPRYNTSTFFNGTEWIKTNTPNAEILTLSCWVKTTKNKSTSQFMIADSTSGLCISFYNGTIISYFGANENKGTGSKCTLGSAYKENDWNHFVVIKTGIGTRKVYCNGVEQVATNNDYWGAASGFFVGSRNNSATLPFYGQISDVRAYATVLTEEEILELYRVGASLSNNGALMAYEFSE
jgi:hypothetical protein